MKNALIRTIARCTEEKTKPAGMKEFEKKKKKTLDKSKSLCYNTDRKQEKKQKSFEGHLEKPYPKGGSTTQLRPVLQRRNKS